MKEHRSRTLPLLTLMVIIVSLTFVSTRLKADTGACGGQMISLPFTDVPASNIFFCSIAEAFISGLTNGTTATTYSPSQPVPREQMAAFVSRTLDQSVKRSNPRAALGEWWTNQSGTRYRSLKSTGSNPRFLTCDGLTVWVSCTEADSVQRFDIRTGDLICTQTGIPSPEQIVVVGDYVWIASAQFQGRLYVTTRNTTSPGAPISIVAGVNPVGMTFDGKNLWLANDGNGPGTGSITSVNLSADPPVVTNFPQLFSQPRGILFDGANLWVTDAGDSQLKLVNRFNGSLLQNISLSGNLGHPIFDGTNLWIPSAATPAGVPNQVFVVRAVGGLIGTVLATLTGNGLNGAFQAAFDGERICVTNALAPSVSLWKATDLTPIGSVVLADPVFNSRGICSDGTTFFIGLRDQSGSSGIGAFCRF